MQIKNRQGSNCPAVIFGFYSVGDAEASSVGAVLALSTGASDCCSGLWLSTGGTDAAGALVVTWDAGGVLVAASSSPPPQAASVSIMAPAIVSAINFFMLYSSSYKYTQMYIYKSEVYSMIYKISNTEKSIVGKYSPHSTFIIG